ncbi:MAG: hypothetical protein AB7U23_12635 [Dehalococcoidia bacterium]
MSTYEEGMLEASKVDNATDGMSHPCWSTPINGYKHSWRETGFCAGCGEECDHEDRTIASDHHGTYEVCVDCNKDIEYDDGDRAYDTWKDDRLERGL